MLMEVIFVEEKSNILTILKIAGTYISCCMGAGFATGQEVMQFFTSYGYLGILGLVGVVILFAWYGWVFMKAGNELKATSAKPVLEFLCGKKLGIVVEWITMSFVFACFSALVSGAGTTLNQYFGINSYLAKVIVTLAICLTALLGLNSIINIISAIAPIAIVLLIIRGATQCRQGYGRDELNQSCTYMVDIYAPLCFILCPSIYSDIIYYGCNDKKQKRCKIRKHFRRYLPWYRCNAY
jgi:uncharacterized membrane protein YkvI